MGNADLDQSLKDVPTMRGEMFGTLEAQAESCCGASFFYGSWAPEDWGKVIGSNWLGASGRL